MNKSDLRKLYLERRGRMTAVSVLAGSREIAGRFFENIDLSAVRSLHTFIPIRRSNEVETGLIYEKVWRDHTDIATLAPRTDLSTGEIESIVFDSSTMWRENRWGISEPINGEVIYPKLIDLVLVPLLCFDNSGHRVGYGKGIYDRFLARCRTDCLKIGVSYFPPIAVIDDVSETDIQLDICITQERIYKCEKDATAAAPLHQIDL